jgi:large subunit ribosomal protein L15
VNLRQLEQVSGDEITPETLFAAGLIGHLKRPVKLLGTGDAPRAFRVRGVAISASARAKIEAKGGSVED